MRGASRARGRDPARRPAAACPRTARPVPRPLLRRNRRRLDPGAARAGAQPVPGAVARLGQQLEGAREWELAQDLYARAGGGAPLAEANYRGAMRCAHACDGAAAAFGVYRRCRETLSIVLGLAPAAETEQLAVSRD
ncbi:hypothetical protein G4G28_11990 [Massilia sp. Dwa41.01b]|uniref:BTAD domain-containing putative transcriptional regulator n=1 Tax=Massilia sp. Dwa41.01b TaxID=2709302 RepID=UPI0018627421|nr:hypothetical protein G4G28_11990 [Massilia sp. Dwa41.01b]